MKAKLNMNCILVTFIWFPCGCDDGYYISIIIVSIWLTSLDKKKYKKTQLRSHRTHEREMNYRKRFTFDFISLNSIATCVTYILQNPAESESTAVHTISFHFISMSMVHVWFAH